MESSRPPTSGTGPHAVLNELLDAEQRALLPRLMQATAFITKDRTADWERIRRMVADRDRILARLVETILRLGGQPAPRTGEITSADFHYVALSALLPRVLAGQRELCRLYDRAAKVLTDSPPAAAVVTDIAAHHRVALETLQKISSDTIAGR